jgi:hypothetical protein
LLTIHPNIKPISLYTLEKSIAAGIFYTVAKNRVKDVEALKWICIASVAQALLSPICNWAMVKQPLHFEKIKNFLEEKKLNYLLSLAESSFLLALSLAPTIMTGLIKKDLKTAFIAFVVLDILNRRLATRFFNARALFANKRYYEVQREELQMYLDLLNSISKDSELYMQAPNGWEFNKGLTKLALINSENGIKFCEIDEVLMEKLKEIKQQNEDIQKNLIDKEVYKSRWLQLLSDFERIKQEIQLIGTNLQLFNDISLYFKNIFN